jgi:hypothetical protein
MSIPADVVAAFAVRFHFHPDFPLQQRLEDTADRYEHHQRLVFSTPSERRAVVGRLHKHLTALLSDLPDLDRVGGSFLLDEPLRQSLARLHAKSAELIAKLTGKRGGGSGADVARRILVTDLYQIYRLGTGRSDRYTQEPGTSNYSGPAIDFIEKAADQLLALELSNSFIGETIKRLQQRG